MSFHCSIPDGSPIISLQEKPHHELHFDLKVQNALQDDSNQTEMNAATDSQVAPNELLHSLNDNADNPSVKDELQSRILAEKNVIILPEVPRSKPSPSAHTQFDDVNDTNINDQSTPPIANDIPHAAATIELKPAVDENQIPVFSEWAQKRIEEAEKQVEQEVVNSSTMKKNASTLHKAPVLKLKSAKNYASPDCGAKIIAANSESSSTGYVLTSTKDEYLLSPCKSRIWFVVELCEAIQAEHIDLANFELFSSSPKNFSVSVSNRFPTRDWSNVGKFIAKDERYVQSFDLYPHLFGKYVRVDVHSHYNSEHFCPISLFRVYGTSEFEAFETENRQHPIDDIDDDDEDQDDADVAKGNTNIFKSASEAVMSIVDSVKKAAAFVKPNENKTDANSIDIADPYSIHSRCQTPNFGVVCARCAENLTAQMTTLLKCKQQLLTSLLGVELIRNSITKSQICANLVGIDLNINCREPISKTSTKVHLTDLHKDYISHLFPIRYVASMCNLLAVHDKLSALFNSTYTGDTDDTATNITIEKKISPILAADDTKTVDTTGGVPTTETAPVHVETVVDNPANSALNTDSNVESVRREHLVDQQATQINGELGSNDENIAGVSTSSPTPPPEDVAEVVVEKPIIQKQNIFNVAQEEALREAAAAAATSATGGSSDNQASTEQVDSWEIDENILTMTEATTASSSEIVEPVDEQTAPGWINQQQGGQKLHSESVFLRLSNRVKVIEFSIIFFTF